MFNVNKLSKKLVNLGLSIVTNDLDVQLCGCTELVIRVLLKFLDYSQEQTKKQPNRNEVV